MQPLPKHHGSRTPQNKKSRDATTWRLYNDVGIENSLLTACELQIRKNGCQTPCLCQHIKLILDRANKAHTLTVVPIVFVVR